MFSQGPVVLLAVILPEILRNKTLNDSKKIKQKREKILEIIIKKELLVTGLELYLRKK